MPFILMVRNSGSNIFRQLFMWIDWVIYNLVSFLLQTVFDIADVDASVFTGLAEGITSKVYLILAIFMLFKVTVSLLTYLVNPDTISDKQQGAGKLVTRIMVTLIMLIATPTVFGLMMRAQAPILRTLPRVIIGKNVYSSNQNQLSAGTEMADNGTRIAWSILKAFYYKNPDCYDGSNFEAPGWSEPIEDNVITKANNHINDYCEVKDDGRVYAYEYTPIISTIAGGFLCYTLIGITIMVAIRMFKMLILQIIAPIPIMSYIDPKASKDGAFSKWSKTLISTWLELFINIGIVYIVIYIVTEIILGEDGSNFLQYVGDLESGRRKAFFLIFVILGLFAFARQAPKFIMDILGIKEGSGFGKALGLSASTLGMIGSARASYAASRAADDTLDRDHNLLRNVGAGLFGAVGGYSAGANATMSAKDQNSRAAFDAMAKRNATALELGRSGGTFFGAVGTEMSRFFTGQTEGDRLEAAWKAEEELIKYDEQRNAERKVIMDRASSKGLESLQTSTTLANLGGNLSQYNGLTANAAEFNSALSAAQNQGLKQFTFGGQTIHMEHAGLLQHEINDGNIADYAEQSLRGTINDTVITGADQRFASANNGVGVERVFAGATGLKATYGNVNNAISRRKINVANQKQSGQAQAATANSKRFRHK